MIVTDVRFLVRTDEGVLDFSGSVRSVQVRDGLSTPPNGSVSLPLKRLTPRSRIPYKNLVHPGDIALLEFHTWDGKAAGQRCFMGRYMGLASARP